MNIMDGRAGSHSLGPTLGSDAESLAAASEGFSS